MEGDQPKEEIANSNSAKQNVKNYVGDVPIKSDFILNRKRPLEGEKNESNSNKTEGCDDCAPKPTKRQMKQKKAEDKLNSLCRPIALGQQCSFGDSCKYVHDVEAFFKTKQPDISSECYNFKILGKCPYGLLCRFASAHTKDFKIVVNEELYQKTKDIPREVNSLTRELQSQLRRESITFPKTSALFKNTSNQPKIIEIKPSSDVNGTLIDKEVSLKPSERKKVDFKDKLYLAPLTTIGNLPFRRICKRFGADITCGEMAIAANLMEGHAAEWALLKRHSSEDVFGVQICGANPELLSECSELLDREISMDFLDINCGCPIDMITSKGAGSALLESPKKLERIVTNVNQVISVPLTIKVRVGRDEKNPTSHKFFPDIEKWGVAAITMHGRSRMQRYSRRANWDYIDQCAKLTNVPVIGNGDIYSYEDYLHHKKNSHISSVMIARGAIIKPWLFTEIKEQRHWDISSSERMEMIRDYCNYGLEHWGSDNLGVDNTRKFLLEWLSFLCRYVPVGILEGVGCPTLQQRPPLYKGRNDIESLLASTDIKDWIKISEMFLGPVSSDFRFNPKHKSNSYNDDSNG